MSPRTAMLLAAGLGSRMRPLTDHTAKPLLPLGGRTLLDHALTRLAAAGIDTVVVNTHWHADRVAAHLVRHWQMPLPPLPLLRVEPAVRAGADPSPAILLRQEERLLETGGSVRAVLHDLGPEPFYVVNGDSFWFDGPGASALARLAAAWDDSLDAVLLVIPTYQVQSQIGTGDFFLDPLGRIRRRRFAEVAPHLYAGVQLLHPRLFDTAPAGTFSINVLWDRAIENDRLRGVVHDGLWFHLSTPPDLAAAEATLQTGMVGDTR